MGIDPPFAKSLAAALALLWLALIAVALPAPEGNRFFPNLRLRPRLAILGALAFGMLFAGIAAWEHGSVPGPDDMEEPGWEAAFEGPARTLSSGAAFVAIAVALAGIGGWIGPRSRIAARGAMLFAVVLLAGAIWPAFSIPRWCASLGAPEDLPEPPPLAAYRPDYDPARWIDAWSRALHPVAPWGMGTALAGIAAGVVLFRRATARADAPGREAACAAVACAGLLAMCGACLEFEKQAAWRAHEAGMETWRFNNDESDEIKRAIRIELGSARVQLADLFRSFAPELAIEAVPEPELTVFEPDTSPAESSPGSAWMFYAAQTRRLEVEMNRVFGSLFDTAPPPPEPEIRRPVSTPFTWIALGVGFLAALFGEFHLRGRRLLRDPETNQPAPEAA